MSRPARAHGPRACNRALPSTPRSRHPTSRPAHLALRRRKWSTRQLARRAKPRFPFLFSLDLQMRTVLVERHLDDLRLHDLAADVDPQLAPRLRVRGRQVARADGYVERRARGPAAYDPARRAVAQHRVPVTRERAL